MSDWGIRVALAAAMSLSLAGPVLAQNVADPARTGSLSVDLPPPDLPDVVVAFPNITPPIDLPPPELPPVVVSMPVNETAQAPAAIDVPPPDLPAVTVRDADYLDGQTVLAARLDKGEALVHPRIGKREREAIKAFYATRQNKPVWLAGEHWTPAAKAVIARLEKAGEDALDQADYPIPQVAILPASGRDEALADADIKLSVAAIAYARDARGARFDPALLGKQVTQKRELPAADEVLRTLTEATDAGAVLAAYQPDHNAYRALKAKLAELRASRPTVPQVRVPLGRPLRVGMRDPRVPLVRVRFGLGGDEDTIYDERVAAAVADFQKENGLPANGVLTRQTVAKLDNFGAARAEDAIIVNMERWRWLPEAFGPNYILVNIPEFKVRVFKGGSLVHEARVITGKPDTPTPVFSNVMRHVIVNPYWNVPPSILKKEFLPKMAENPNYAAEHGYEVIRRGNNISIRQPPGERNALGRIKFMFPNEHSVYLHDTPSRKLFSAERRAFSHGCVRVDDPFRFAEIVLGKQNGWPEARVKALMGKSERLIQMKEPLPIHLAYFTASVDSGDKLVLRDDLYGYDARMIAALRARD